MPPRYNIQRVPVIYTDPKEHERYKNKIKNFPVNFYHYKVVMSYPEGTIRVNSQGHKFVKENGKWNYIKKPKRDIVKSNKVTYNYPDVKIPDGMKETQYPGYYITMDGRAFRKPGKYDRTGKYGEIDENGLIYLKPAFRGHPKYPEHQYECVNISVYDENGKYKQIKRSIHQLVAEAFVPNPYNHTEIDHIDRNKINNHYTNLRWVSRFENASEPNSKSYTITDTITGKVWKGIGLRNWVSENYDLIKSRWRKKNCRSIEDISNSLIKSRCLNNKVWGFIVEF
jgi:hypothetical protein